MKRFIMLFAMLITLSTTLIMAQEAETPDTPRIAFVRGGVSYTDTPAIYTMNPDGTDVQLLLDIPFGASLPAWSPDGSKIAFTGVPESDSQIFIADADGSNIVQITDCDMGCLHPTWSPDGQQIAYSKIDIDQMVGQIQLLYIIDITGENERPLTTPTGFSLFDVNPDWSPNGQQIAFIRGSGSSSDLHIINIDGTNLRKITTDAPLTIIGYPDWSPNGRTIAFMWGRDATANIYLISPDGSNLRRITDDTTVDTFATWLPNGRELLLESSALANPDENTGIYLINADGTNKRQIVNADLNVYKHPVWQPAPRGDVVCEVVSSRAVNQRSTASTSSTIAEILQPNQPIFAVGQTVGSDNFVWWQLDNGNWVRSDTVVTTEDCERLPIISN